MKNFLVYLSVGLIFATESYAQRVRSHFELSLAPAFVASPKIWSNSAPNGKGLKFGISYDGRYVTDLLGKSNFYLVTTVGGTSLMSASQSVGGATVKSNENIFHVLEGVEYIGSANGKITPHFGLNAGISIFGRLTTITNGVKSSAYPATLQPRIAVSGNAGLILFPADNYGIDLSLEYEVANAALRSKTSNPDKSIAFDVLEHYVSYIKLNIGIAFRLSP